MQNYKAFEIWWNKRDCRIQEHGLIYLLHMNEWDIGQSVILHYHHHLRSIICVDCLSVCEKAHFILHLSFSISNTHYTYIYRTMLGFSVQLLQQFTGINAVMYFAPVIFKSFLAPSMVSDHYTLSLFTPILVLLSYKPTPSFTWRHPNNRPFWQIQPSLLSISCQLSLLSI